MARFRDWVPRLLRVLPERRANQTATQYDVQGHEVQDYAPSYNGYHAALNHPYSADIILPKVLIFGLLLVLLYYLSGLWLPLPLGVLLCAFVVLVLYTAMIRSWQMSSRNVPALLSSMTLLISLSYVVFSGEPLALSLVMMVLVLTALTLRSWRGLLLHFACAWLGLVGLLVSEQLVLAVPALRQLLGLMLLATVTALLAYQLKRQLETTLRHAAQREIAHQHTVIQAMRTRYHSEERFRHLADASFEGIIFHDGEKIIDANRRALQIFGYSLERLQHMTWLELLAPRARDLASTRLARHLSVKQNAHQAQHSQDDAEDTYESFGLHRDGRIFPIDVLERTLPSHQQHIIAASVRDATVRKEQEGKVHSYQQELEQRNAQLVHANKLQARVLANVSHELRTPLAAINGFAELLEGEFYGPLNAKQKRYVSDIHDSGKHLLALINDILDVSKAEAQRMTLHLQHTVLCTMVHEALTVVRAQAQAKGISLEVDCQSHSSLPVDPLRIRQVLYNYLANAVKFTPVGGDVCVRVYETPEAIVTEVSDTGIGIRQEDQAKLFKPFVQLDNGTDRSQEGTGLGLALCRTLITLHGGEVWVDSSPGHGSTFAFSLPKRATLYPLTHTL